MKDIVKSVVRLLPDSLRLRLMIMRRKMHYYHLNRMDVRRFKKYAFMLNNNNDQINLMARLTFHTHAIEKGLSNRNLRKGFGKRAISSLMSAMAEYETKKYSLREDRFQAALSVLHTYCEIHENEPKYTDYINEFLKKYEYHGQIKSGSNEYVREDVLQDILGDFYHLSKARMSVRDYSEEPVDDDLIYSALEIAQKTPSVCNRQTWRVHLIKDEKILAEVLKLQGGLTGNGNNLKRLILVTTDLRYFSKGQERNQGYMDGGIYLMSLVYALTYKGLANCVLNADFALSREIEMRKLLGLEDSEVMISFISVGNYPEKFKSPISPRDSYVESLIVH